MPRVFPGEFEPHNWEGPKAHAHHEAEDAFQQLVGDRLKEELGSRAHVASTRGRDGSIDIWLEAGRDATEQEYLGLPLPIVVECKYHDARARNVRGNVLQAWERVRRKLREQAEQGWRGVYEPWQKVRGYLYCVSAVLPNPQARQELEDKVRRFFFEELLPAQRPPQLEAVQVLDWSDVRAWLDQMRGVADRWLGTELLTVVPHEAYVKGLSGFRRYLLAEALPFVPPAHNAPYHPDALFRVLEARAGEGGLLLVGQGGIGKTRTATEVAARAKAAGWHVLHVLGGEPAVTVEHLAAAALPGRGTTLFIFDYLDQMSQLDLGSLRHRLLPEARTCGVNLALLATARRELLQVDQRELVQLFTQVHLAPTAEHSRDIAHVIQERLAPHAADILGAERVAALCGTRPIIAMFIARELERRAQAGTLNSEAVVGFREGELLGWLQARLADDGLVLPPVRGLLTLLPPEPDHRVLAAAAVLAATPQDWHGLEQASTASLKAIRSDLRDRAGQVVQSLLNLGWLELQGNKWVAAHDVVADEVLEQVLCVRPAGLVRRPSLEAVLAAAGGSARTFGRMAVSLGRLLGPGPAPPAFASHLQQAAVDWLAGAVTVLGPMLVDANPDEAAYALGAAVSGPPWADAVMERWDALIGRWLDQHGRCQEARHLLYCGLRRAAEDGETTGTSLVGHALAWLQDYVWEPEASFVLSPLLGRKNLGARAAEAVDLAFEWLQAHGAELEAGFVLSALLDRQELGARAAGAIDLAFQWLQGHGIVTQAQFVLRPLLKRPDLSARAAEAIDLAFEWLQAHSAELEASFVLSALLDRQELGARAAEAIDLGFEWLQAHGAELEAGFVLSALLPRSDLGPRDEVAIALALEWLGQHADSPDAEFVFRHLFRRRLPRSVSERASRRALDRLEAIMATSEASFLLRSVLQARDLLPASDEARVVRLALHWLDRHPSDPDLDYVANRLLRRPDLDDADWRRAADRLVDWLRRSPDQLGWDYALNSLVNRPHLLSKEEREFLNASGQRPVTMDTELYQVPITDAETIGHMASIPAKSQLLRLARDRNADIDAAVVEEALAEAKRLLEEERPAAAGILLAPLLPLAARLLNPILQERVNDLAMRIGSNPTLRSDQHVALLQRCYQLLDTWPVREVGEEVLEKLALGAPGLFRLAREKKEAKIDSARLQRAVTTAEALLDADRTASVGYYLAPLLPLVARVDDPVLEKQVHDLTRRFLADPALEPEVSDGFAVTCCRLLDVGAWPSRITGEQVLERIGFESAGLSRLARDSAAPIDPARLQRVVATAEALLEADRTASVSYYLAPLLPLVARVDDPVLEKQVHDLVRRFLADPALKPEARDGFARACRQLFADGAWLDVEAGDNVLKKLGIATPELDRLALDPKAPVDPAQLEWALTTVKELLSSGQNRSAGRFLAPLLPVTARTDPALGARAHDLVRSFLADPALAPKVRDGFKQACRQLFAKGAWLDVEAGDNVLEKLGIAAPELDRLVLDPKAPVDPARLQRALNHAKELLETSSPGSARHVLKRLLPLCARLGDRGLEAEAHELVRTMLAHPALGTWFKKSFARDCQELLDAGAWPDFKAGIETLARLGLSTVPPMKPT